MVEKFNRITAKGVKGIYKDQSIEVRIGKTYVDTQIFIDGKKIDLVQSIHISMRVGKVTTITIEKFKGQ